METVLEITNLVEFKRVLSKMKVALHMQIMHDYVSLVRGLAGGCSCNRKSRTNEAK